MMTMHAAHEVAGRESRWSLPLEHQSLELQTEVARVTVVPVGLGEKPYLEVQGGSEDGPTVEVDAGDTVTRVRIAGLAHGPSWWNGPWWETSFWDKRFWKQAARAHIVLHVPPDVRGVLRSNAARMHVERLSACDLSIATDAGLLDMSDVTGRLRLSTQAGRIEARRIGGSLDITTSAGTVHAEVTSLVAGTHRIKTSVGAVRLELARGLAVRIQARTSMGATRIDYPTTDDADTLLDLEADLGAIRVTESSAMAAAPPPASPYRTAAASPLVPRNDLEIERILAHVADGSITPEAARDLLRALGVT